MRIPLLFCLLCLIGCARIEPQSAIAAAGATSTSPDCNDWTFIATPIDAQWDMLQATPKYRCRQTDAQDSGLLDCAPSPGLVMHGLRVGALNISHPMGADRMQVAIVDAFDTAAEALARAFGRPADIDDNGQRLTWVSRHDDDRERRATVFTDSQGKVQLNCSIAAAIDPTDGTDAQGAAYGDALVRALTHCEAVTFMHESADARRQALAGARLTCAAGTHEGLPGTTCRLPADARSWGDTSAEELFIGDRDGERYGIVRIAAPAPRVRTAIEASMQMTMTPIGNAGEARFDGGLDDMYRMRIAPRRDGKTDLHCAYTVADATSAGPGGTEHDRAAHAGGPFPQNNVDARAEEHHMPRGSISGAIRYPDGSAPAMRICAINGQSAIHGCTETAAGADRYRIDDLPGADYVVIAQPHSGERRSGGHMQAVQCIRAPCPDMLASVFVPAGGAVGEIDINGFFEKRDDFPTMPADD